MFPEHSSEAKPVATSTELQFCVAVRCRKGLLL